MENDLDLQPLSQAEIYERLINLPGWKYSGNKITKTFEFKSFSDGLELVNSLAPFCNEIDHHPDIIIKYKKITFELSRFSIGSKVTERDFTVAKKIEKLYSDIKVRYLF
ncbi:TPA: 4a-hydroxytetrahydrobiopterin dehydratase [Candidatus Berkelbacteria bacterium]|uniref:4a-hydroxytetrahydrobiopterin dehydratase n=1 Tax=Berkelbacteria bacterium GW2011_GWE1_39_12 TaxID=1618337 RepID=A0A0G4B3E5_9BACT|nr:MAG: pterin-4-alpha-carbinolamine dehydratase, 4a-hydroxytetrahydrobiopterin dehydratase [Berkelbacteria bacterium GW2011_GWE1_39_12]HBO60954.1 4a-hydroxytetrahydrobiopterin dehydratase [Candidatus Berkelbacteria bacterium]